MDICIDGGATKVRVVCRSSTGVSDFVIEQGANYRVIGAEGVNSVVRKIIRTAKIKKSDRVRILAGFAGAADPTVRDQISNMFRAVVPSLDSIEVMTDFGLGLRALNDDGIVLICGTGAACAGMTNGRIERAAGRGYLFDEGSGFFMGQELLASLFKYLDGHHIESSAFEKAQIALCTRSADDLVALIYSSTGPNVEQVASLAPIVIAEGMAGDALCADILNRSVVALSEMTASVLKRMNRRRSTVGLIGGVFQHEQAKFALIRPLYQKLSEAGYETRLERLGFDTEDLLVLALKNTFGELSMNSFGTAGLHPELVEGELVEGLRVANS